MDAVKLAVAIVVAVPDVVLSFTRREYGSENLGRAQSIPPPKHRAD